jgi:hypothetical protein
LLRAGAPWRTSEGASDAAMPKSMQAPPGEPNRPSALAEQGRVVMVEVARGRNAQVPARTLSAPLILPAKSNTTSSSRIVRLTVGFAMRHAQPNHQRWLALYDEDA